MTETNKWLSVLDAIAITSFIVGLANYEENVDQSALNETVSSAVSDIHEHLKVQDEKIDKILATLGVK
mgnify:FL=1